ncbi:hypothetical protein ACJ72_03599 [Emergomyces africanus]|uniref:Uncharacterized protein n=1 Tax=Emergomyces africanus TaxID=1955775 RepID=A0A1B7NZK6_9EURO|nr:hypothetical protein ACJ72_03599 [Emergomyces africanus]
MSKAISHFFDGARKASNIMKKFKGSLSAGSRIFPAKTQRNDEEFELKMEAGELIENRWREIILQVNSQAKNRGLRYWVRKNGRTTHGILAISRYDTTTENHDEETLRVMTALEESGKATLKNLTG